ncbi:hypothetical protein C8T65DRAFT_662709 [Cerioporus squamosus]|nr:hypothetical protein C8T65DRAFT_662709 [Cerioporus squamosus]
MLTLRTPLLIVFSSSQGRRPGPRTCHHTTPSTWKDQAKLAILPGSRPPSGTVVIPTLSTSLKVLSLPVAPRTQTLRFSPSAVAMPPWHLTPALCSGRRCSRRCGIAQRP